MDLVAIDTLVQRIVPRPLLGRVFGAVGTAAQLGASLAYAGAGPLVAVAGPRGAFLIAAAGVFSVLVLRRPNARARRRVPRSERDEENRGGNR
jgi:MFS family permease